MDEELLIPFADCGDCDDKLPVFIRKAAEFPEILEIIDDEDKDIEIVICIRCTAILNLTGDLEIEWFDEKEIEKVGYKIVGEQRESGE